ncbi:hypothetical protein [Paenibacillus sp. GbtcB18]|uniref:hypothetical protein n=1 Tax=Paenibacillus sp. GbtcB18 TaxID=2824763 RepID=UPI0020C67A37|nr:hypothetical protein [Paenibacillus sp. GbtcB18]
MSEHREDNWDENAKRQLLQFIEKHHEKLKRYQLMDDENELADELAIKEQIPIVFALYTASL